MSEKTLGIVGGGISGLTAAYYAMKNGQNPKNIVIYEADNRLGGQVMNGVVDGKIVNKGPEFIDSDQVKLLKLCEELGVPLKSASDQTTIVFQKVNGDIMQSKDFFAAYNPIFEQIRLDKLEIAAQPNGDLAKHLNSISMEQYLQELGDVVPAIANRSLLGKMWDTVTFNKNRVDPEIIKMAARTFSSEAGQPPDKVSALQFVHEASSKPDSFLNSDCAYRVEGGTEQLIHKLREKLEAAGVQFHTGNEATSVAKNQDGTINLALNTKSPDGMSQQNATHDTLIMALPAYDLAQIGGLDSLGFSPLASKLQYTSSMKVTIKVNPDMVDKIPNENFFANDGFQSWVSAPGTMTFLINTDPNSKNPDARVKSVLETYARAYNLKADDIFDSSHGNYTVTNPKKTPCYATPAIGQAIALENFQSDIKKLNDNGIFITGTFFPSRSETGESLGIGFMENGADRSYQVAEEIMRRSAQGIAMQQLVSREPQQELEAQVPVLPRGRGGPFRG